MMAGVRGIRSSPSMSLRATTAVTSFVSEAIGINLSGASSVRTSPRVKFLTTYDRAETLRLGLSGRASIAALIRSSSSSALKRTTRLNPVIVVPSTGVIKEDAAKAADDRDDPANDVRGSPAFCQSDAPP